MEYRRLLPFYPASPLSTESHPVSAARAVQVGSRIFLSACSALDRDGAVLGLGDPAAQTEATLDNLEGVLNASGAALSDVAKLTVRVTDHAHVEPASRVINRRLHNVRAAWSGVIVRGLSLPEILLEIDAEVAIGVPAARAPAGRSETSFWEDFPSERMRSVVTDDEIFLGGQTGNPSEERSIAGAGRQPGDAAIQADAGMSNLVALLNKLGSGLDEVCKVTVQLSDRGYRSAVYPVLGRYFGDVRPVSTGLVVAGFARPETLFQIDTEILRKHAGPHDRLRPYHSDTARYGRAQQNLGCKLCMAVRAGPRIHLRGQTGVDLQEKMHGLGDAVAQARQAMENVTALLADAGTSLHDVVKVTVFVTDRAFLPAVTTVVFHALDGVLPTFSAMVVKGLASSDLLMEVDVTAVRSESLV